MLSRRQFMLALAVGACAPPLRARTAAPSIHRIEIKSFAFEPSRVEVRVGDVVEWVNRDLAPHTATADNDSWNTGLLKGEAASRLVMTKPGEHAYHCTYHPQMRGVVAVVS
ncbi:cupredoxin family copper-binding protein [Burkholderia sp. SCN-KJ]|uniref:cupredoxin domain-containing protein n=1 Tax=Burkholderia sp. SCN-KJ TaxID=2969248 RepID=UPI00214F9CBB|nr:cupredoxin family copper-binding protein [Burkholderia sp. SCN-KJ]MCR4470455.1 cupredoxin family copper-binding protein [Burkholderia sp. SCN-KJ]